MVLVKLEQPKVLSRGFVFEQTEEKLFNDAVRVVEKALKPIGETIMDHSTIRKQTMENLEKFFMDKRSKKPMVIVEIIQF
jgi:mRNA degradation ribonuclease J1/J2